MVSAPRAVGSRPGPLQIDDFVRDDGTVEPLELERTDLLGGHEIGHGGVDPLADENLIRRRLGAQAVGEVGHAADGGVVLPPLEADRADRRVALRDAHAEVEVVAAPAPFGAEHPDPGSHGLGHTDGALLRVRDRHRVVEEDHHAVAGEALKGALASAWAVTVSWSALILSSERTRAERAAWSTGLVRYSSAPASSPATMSFASVIAVTRMIGVNEGSGIAFSRRQTSIPSTFGIMTSSRIKSGRASRATASASAPSTAVTTS